MTAAAQVAKPLASLPYHIIIPARLASTRLPNKPLADIGGLPMVVRVARQALQSRALSVVVACDAHLVLAACQQHGIKALMTRSDHASGSARVAEAAQLLDLAPDAWVINVQGDEPFIDPLAIDQLAQFALKRPELPMCTLAHVLHDQADFQNPHVVKVVCDQQQRALYFSRAPIPHRRDTALAPTGQGLPDSLKSSQFAPLRHIGSYSYRRSFLHTLSQLPPCALEQLEALEQLRVLAHGYAIGVETIAQAPLPGVDTAADLARARAYVAQPA